MTKYEPFPNTHWSLVKRIGLDDEVARQEALRILLERYVPALRSYLRMVRRLPEDDTDELLQSFIAEKILEQDLIRHADQSRGRFRSLLLTSLRNFAVSQRRSQNGKRASASVDGNLEDDNPTCEIAVQAAWARALIHGTIDVMEAECRRTGRTDVWRVFEERILGQLFHDRRPTPYEDLARSLTLPSPTHAANLLVTAKRMYDRLLRAAVAEYEMEPAEIDEEIADLWRVLSQSPAFHDEPGE